MTDQQFQQQLDKYTLEELQEAWNQLETSDLHWTTSLVTFYEYPKFRAYMNSYIVDRILTEGEQIDV